jgi:hypothetical protein
MKNCEKLLLQSLVSGVIFSGVMIQLKLTVEEVIDIAEALDDPTINNLRII